jgi:hypothetical protein
MPKLASKVKSIGTGLLLFCCHIYTITSSKAIKMPIIIHPHKNDFFFFLLAIPMYQLPYKNAILNSKNGQSFFE